MNKKRLIMLFIIVSLLSINLFAVDVNYDTSREGFLKKYSRDRSVNLTIAQPEIANFPLIHAIVSVKDADGNSISGLLKDDFGVSEDLVPAIFDVEEIGNIQANQVSIPLVIDRSGSMSGNPMDDAKDAAHNFVDNLNVASNDRSAIVSFASDVTVDQPMTADKDLLHNAINDINAGGMTALYDGFYKGVEQCIGEAGVKAVIGFSDGNNTTSNTHSKQDVIDLANQHSIPIYAIAVGNFDPIDLQDMAYQTGGEYYEAPTAAQIDSIYAEISQGIQNQYEIIFETPNTATDGTDRVVEISVDYSGDTSNDDFTYTAPDDDPPDIGTTPETDDLIGSTQQNGSPIPISVIAEDYDTPPDIHLYYRTTGSGDDYTEVPMQIVTDSTWEYEVPGIDVVDPGIQFYVTSEDASGNTVTLPEIHPTTYTFPFGITPNASPEIVHTVPQNANPNTPLTLTAEITDDSYVDSAKVFYRKSDMHFYHTVSMDNTSGDNYEGVVPASYMEEPGLEYFISAWDQYGVRQDFGNSDNPFIIPISSNIFEPPTDLDAQVANNCIELSWNAPPSPEDWIYWGDNVYHQKVGAVDPGEWCVASRFGESFMSPYINEQITKLKIFPMEPTSDYAARIWKRDFPDSLVEVRDIALNNPTIGSWNTVDVDPPVTIESGYEYWLGYWINQVIPIDTLTHTGYSAGADDGPSENGFWIYFPGYDWTDYSAMGYDFNWLIQGYIETFDKDELLVMSNRIASGSEKANETEKLGISPHNMANNLFSIVPASGNMDVNNSATVARTKDKGIVGYNIFRSTTPNIYDYDNPLAFSSSTFYEDCNVQPGVTYYYTVTAVYSNPDGESGPSNQVSEVVLGNDVEVTVEDVSGAPGQSDVPVTISMDNSTNTNNIPVAAVEMWLEYDAGVGIDANGGYEFTSRTQGYSASINVEGSGSNTEAHILLYNMSGGVIDPGTGPIFKLLFDIDNGAAAGDSSPLEFSDCILADINSDPISVDYSDTGIFTIGVTGDINLDGNVNILDVQIVINVILGNDNDPGHISRSDLNGDGNVNILDLQNLINIIISPMNSEAENITKESCTLELPEFVMRDDTTGTFGINLENGDPVVSGQFRFTYDSTIGFHIDGVNTTTRTSGYDVVFDPDESDPGEVEILVLFYNMQGEDIDSGAGDILEFSWSTGDAENGTPLEFTEAILSNSSAEPMSVTTVDGNVEAYGVGNVGNQLETILGQNYPNPFESQTSISYTLSRNSFVTLSIYNVKGELVETLVSKRLETGEHNTTWQSTDIKPGIYFYKMETDASTFTKKMLIVK